MVTRRELRRDDIPLHWEGVGLALAPRLLGWTVGLVGSVTGGAAMVRQHGAGLEVVGAFAAALGVLALVAVVRCRQCELTLGRRWLKLVCGPWQRDLPLTLVAAARVRAASSWRRLYAPQEVVLALVGGGEAALPSGDPDELVRLLVGESGLRAGG